MGDGDSHCSLLVGYYSQASKDQQEFADSVPKEEHVDSPGREVLVAALN
jgi:hypothetical protein